MSYAKASQTCRELREVLKEVDDFLTHRDHMNGAIHCSETRWSPLTIKVRVAIEKTNDYITFGKTTKQSEEL